MLADQKPTVSFGTPLLLGAEEKQKLAALREAAAKSPVDMPKMMESIKTPKGKKAHSKQMTQQSVYIPFGFVVTFSIERGHPAGTCRHMSMSSDAQGRVPTPEAVWMICQELGFVGGYELCSIWEEALERGNGKKIAMNIVQPIDVLPPSRGAA